MVYELVLSMSLASFVLGMSEDCDEGVDRLAEILKVFTSAVDLYSSNLKDFPERILDVTLRASSLMIKSCEVQMEKSFMKWSAAHAEATSRRENRNKVDVRSSESFFDNAHTSRQRSGVATQRRLRPRRFDSTVKRVPKV